MYLRFSQQFLEDSNRPKHRKSHKMLIIRHIVFIVLLNNICNDNFKTLKNSCLMTVTQLTLSLCKEMQNFWWPMHIVHSPAFC